MVRPMIRMTENPWHRLPHRRPFVLPEDAAVVRDYNERASDDHKLHIDELLPEPFVGNPEAPVVVLGNNPGFNSDRAHYKQEACFLVRMRANLLHETLDCPFVFFDPRVDPELRPWWERKLKGLLDFFTHNQLAASILAIEHFPYPSRRYPPRWRGGLPSKAQDYSFDLVRKALERKAVIVLTRGKRRWLRDVPELAGYEGFCELRNKQRAGISSGNCDRFREVVRAIASGVTE
jgi:hypothetical protein